MGTKKAQQYSWLEDEISTPYRLPSLNSHKKDVDSHEAARNSELERLHGIRQGTLDCHLRTQHIERTVNTTNAFLRRQRDSSGLTVSTVSPPDDGVFKKHHPGFGPLAQMQQKSKSRKILRMLQRAKCPGQTRSEGVPWKPRQKSRRQREKAAKERTLWVEGLGCWVTETVPDLPVKIIVTSPPELSLTKANPPVPLLLEKPTKPPLHEVCFVCRILGILDHPCNHGNIISGVDPANVGLPQLRDKDPIQPEVLFKEPASVEVKEVNMVTLEASKKHVPTVVKGADVVADVRLSAPQQRPSLPEKPTTQTPMQKIFENIYSDLKQRKESNSPSTSKSGKSTSSVVHSKIVKQRHSVNKALTSSLNAEYFKTIESETETPQDRKSLPCLSTGLTQKREVLDDLSKKFPPRPQNILRLYTKPLSRPKPTRNVATPVRSPAQAQLLSSHRSSGHLDFKLPCSLRSPEDLKLGSLPCSLRSHEDLKLGSLPCSLRSPEDLKLGSLPCSLRSHEDLKLGSLPCSLRSQEDLKLGSLPCSLRSHENLTKGGTYCPPSLFPDLHGQWTDPDAGSSIQHTDLDFVERWLSVSAEHDREDRHSQTGGFPTTYLLVNEQPSQHKVVPVEARSPGIQRDVGRDDELLHYSDKAVLDEAAGVSKNMSVSIESAMETRSTKLSVKEDDAKYDGSQPQICVQGRSSREILSVTESSSSPLCRAPTPSLGPSTPYKSWSLVETSSSALDLEVHIDSVDMRSSPEVKTPASPKIGVPPVPLVVATGPFKENPVQLYPYYKKPLPRVALNMEFIETSKRRSGLLKQANSISSDPQLKHSGLLPVNKTLSNAFISESLLEKCDSGPYIRVVYQSDELCNATSEGYVQKAVDTHKDGIHPFKSESNVSYSTQKSLPKIKKMHWYFPLEGMHSSTHSKRHGDRASREVTTRYSETGKEEEGMHSGTQVERHGDRAIQEVITRYSETGEEEEGMHSGTHIESHGERASQEVTTRSSDTGKEKEGTLLRRLGSASRENLLTESKRVTKLAQPRADRAPTRLEEPKLNTEHLTDVTLKANDHIVAVSDGTDPGCSIAPQSSQFEHIKALLTIWRERSRRASDTTRLGTDEKAERTLHLAPGSSGSVEVPTRSMLKVQAMQSELVDDGTVPGKRQPGETNTHFEDSVGPARTPIHGLGGAAGPKPELLIADTPSSIIKSPKIQWEHSNQMLEKNGLTHLVRTQRSRSELSHVEEHTTDFISSTFSDNTGIETSCRAFHMKSPTTPPTQRTLSPRSRQKRPLKKTRSNKKEPRTESETKKPSKSLSTRAALRTGGKMTKRRHSKKQKKEKRRTVPEQASTPTTNFLCEITDLMPSVSFSDSHFDADISSEASSALSLRSHGDRFSSQRLGNPDDEWLAVDNGRAKSAQHLHPPPLPHRPKRPHKENKYHLILPEAGLNLQVSKQYEALTRRKSSKFESVTFEVEQVLSRRVSSVAVVVDKGNQESSSAMVDVADKLTETKVNLDQPLLKPSSKCQSTINRERLLQLKGRREEQLLQRIRFVKRIIRHAAPVGKTSGKLNGEVGGDEEYDFLASYRLTSPSSMNVYRNIFQTVQNNHQGLLSIRQTAIALHGVCSSMDLSRDTFLDTTIRTLDTDPDDGVDLKTFSVLATLATRLSRRESWLRFRVQDSSFLNLVERLAQYRGLWECCRDPETNTIPTPRLLTILQAGGVREKDINNVRRLRPDYVHMDLLEFLSHIPLFCQIHQNIINRPLSDDTMIEYSPAFSYPTAPL